MKKILLSLLTTAILFSCAQNQSEEERFTYENDRIVDTETGDEYMVEDQDTYTVTHPDGEQETVTYEETPFYGTEAADEFLERYNTRLAERKETLLVEQKNKIKQARKERYAEYSDKELIEQFNQLHKDLAPYEQQMDIIAELVERGAVTEEEAVELMEVDEADINFDIDYDPEENAEEIPTP
ncbi:hypothetical protein KI659_12305 [Litoribacter alkaliphilus]|uniref:Lipoprotein n=1 Tax=Litoribacter ruber TaxID=702568 RepID=A0AAP2CHG9_9BACT|nr:hypothetical protein [Litoribacter alkaliphilus]MBS9524793.1 hypothetical protein [Litoribacter alkaliphilus]